MKNTLLLFLFFLPLAVSAQELLDRYTGTYSGTLYLLRDGRTDSVACSMVIAPAGASDRWTSQMIFHSGKGTQINAYEWVRDPEKGTYTLDEKDGILITETLIDSIFYALYTVDGMQFFVRTGFRGDVIDYELTVLSATAGLTSASTEEETEVRSFPVMTVQKGMLRKEE